MVAAPKAATAANMVTPTWRVSGRRAKVKAQAKAPAAGALRKKPNPIGPTCNMSRA